MEPCLGFPLVYSTSDPTLAVLSPNRESWLLSDMALPDSQPWQRLQALASDPWLVHCVQIAQKCSLPAWEPGVGRGWAAASPLEAKEEELARL